MDENTRTQIGRPQDPRDGLEAVVALRRLLEALEAAQVENAFIAGWSWAQIAEALGVSKQAVHKKHARRIKDKYPGDPPRRKGKGACCSTVSPINPVDVCRLPGKKPGCSVTTRWATRIFCWEYSAPRRGLRPKRSRRWA